MGKLNKKISTNLKKEARDDVINQMYRVEKKLGILFGCFSTIAVLIACLGLFGQASHACERHTKVIRIRKMVGTSTFDILNRMHVTGIANYTC